jgi:hypothetical protein
MGLTFDGVNGISATGNIISSQGFISVTGNIYAGNIIATIASSVISINGNVTSGNVLSGGIISATGNIQGGNIRTNGIMSAASLSLDSPLLVANGGTGTTTIPANRVILGNGTGAVTTVAPSTNYNSLISNGTTWTSAPLIGSTWTSLGNRSQGVNYTNDTGKWIQVCGNFGCNGGGQGQIYIDGALISYWAAQFNGCGGFSVNMPCLVPPGSTYQLTAMGGAFRSWYELR